MDYKFTWSELTQDGGEAGGCEIYCDQSLLEAFENWLVHKVENPDALIKLEIVNYSK